MNGASDGDGGGYKRRCRALKRRLKLLLYEQECFQEELRRAQRKLLKVSRDKSFLLDRLLQYENVDDDSSDSEATASSDNSDGDAPKGAEPPPAKRSARGNGVPSWRPKLKMAAMMDVKSKMADTMEAKIQDGCHNGCKIQNGGHHGSQNSRWRHLGCQNPKCRPSWRPRFKMAAIMEVKIQHGGHLGGVKPQDGRPEVGVANALPSPAGASSPSPPPPAFGPAPYMMASPPYSPFGAPFPRPLPPQGGARPRPSPARRSKGTRRGQPPPAPPPPALPGGRGGGGAVGGAWPRLSPSPRRRWPRPPAPPPLPPSRLLSDPGEGGGEGSDDALDGDDELVIDLPE
ncbi:LOW QUALITY PROTEIN: INO80 complex subunit E [Passer domesticus]|uniref:LOW QUALITY PROTEIN: INO80 complex subunit E n=1 Tax=Passer domesticus TaxID=48849 RepID=UPI0030FE0315